MFATMKLLLIYTDEDALVLKMKIQQVRELEAQARQSSEMKNLERIMKTAVGVLNVYFAFSVFYFPRFIL